MKKQILVVGLIICILFVATVLLSPNCRHAKQQQLHHEESHPAVTSIVQTASNDSQIHGQKTASYTLSKEVNKALEHGAKAKVTLKVVDSSGNSVSGARVHVHFTFYNRDKNEVIGFTDSSGMFTAEKETTLSFKWNIQKEGYYATNGKRFLIDGLSNDSVKDGRWQPWNPTIEVVLKEKRNIMKGIFDYVNINTPKDTVIGFDCLKGDWQPPVGQGVHADIMFLYRSDYNGTFGYLTNSLTISTQGSLDGFIKYKQDAFSKYWSVYDAPKNGYQPLLVFEQARTLYKMSKNTILEDGEYLVFCSTRGDGKKYYGKIRDFKYGEDYKKKGHGFVKFEYYINPTPNDRRLEIEK